jgi:Golgi nucleoside diphosphatase
MKNKNKTRTTFTYYSLKIRRHLDGTTNLEYNLFKHTSVGMSFKGTNTLQQLTKPKIDRNIQEQDKSRVFELACNTCQLSYIGQTNHSLNKDTKNTSDTQITVNPNWHVPCTS